MSIRRAPGASKRSAFFVHFLPYSRLVSEGNILLGKAPFLSAQRAVSVAMAAGLPLVQGVAQLAKDTGLAPRGRGHREWGEAKDPRGQHRAAGGILARGLVHRLHARPLEGQRHLDRPVAFVDDEQRLCLRRHEALRKDVLTALDLGADQAVARVEVVDQELEDPVPRVGFTVPPVDQGDARELAGVNSCCSFYLFSS